MKTRFTLTALALTSTLAFSTSAMAASNPATGEFNVTIKLTGVCEVETNSGLTTAINSDNHASAGADINFGTHEAQANSALITGKSTAGTGEGLNIKCSKNTPFSIGLLPQNSGATTAGAGVMTGVNLNGGSHSDTVKYQLYQPATSAGAIADNGSHTSKPWGNDKGTNTVDLIGKGLNDVIKVPVYADVPAGELDKTPDRYQDRVTVSVSY
jgi:pilus biogenesis protein